ncbi:terminase large subunit domain-containing protein [Enterococcus sp. N249-2]
MAKKKQLSLLEQREMNLMKWASFWRDNPHRFVEEYLGIKLFFFQKILIYMLNKVPFFMYIAARGQGKSFIVAVYSIARCILYPGTKIIIASGIKNQSRLIISEKIVDLYNKHPAVAEEIGDYKTNIRPGINQPQVIFKNGSKIEAVPSSDNARGYRGNILIADEFRLIARKTVDEVLKPILNVPRTPEFMLRPEYKNYPKEKNIEIYISSAWYKSHWIWQEFESYLKGMLTGVKNFVSCIPYQISILHGVLDQDRIEADRTKETADETVFKMEYEAMFIGENEKGYFKLDPMNRSRVLNKVFIPPTNLEYIENKTLSKPKKLSNMPRQTGEIRLVGLDVALLGGSDTVKNDTSTFTLMRMIPGQENSYSRHVVYLETIKDSIESSNLAIRLKQLYYDFESDYAIIDANGNGLGVYDACAATLYDEERDVEYEPWTSINDVELQKRFQNNDGKPILYTYKGNAKLNSEIAVSLRAGFNNGKIKLPINDIQKREDILTNDRVGFLSKSAEEQHRQLYAYQQATALISELTALEYTISDGGNIRIKEVGSATKDRYSSLGYVNHRAEHIERENAKQNEVGYEDYFFINNWKG